MILTLLGGVGLFLLGMILLSEGLRSAAGGALRSILQRFARTPARAVLSGASVTALVQSSSATTLTTIGFVSAGLLTFPQAVGLIFGANLGTTSTGWLVAVLGFKVDMGAVALPLVGVGALLRLLGPGRWSHGGMALAGFGLIFVGIDTLQAGMADLATRVDPSSLPGATLLGRLALVGAGAVMTVVMQSSSAAVATTLTALHAGGIDLDQAAVLVIGQNLGTSVKAVIAAVGGSVPVRRTAVAHTLFNLITAALALLFLPLLLAGASAVAGAGDPTVAIALFHTGFNLLGVLVLFPVLGRFAELVERVVPESRPSLTRNLDPSVAQIPEVAVEAASRCATAVAELLAVELTSLLSGKASSPGGRGRGQGQGRGQGEAREPARGHAAARVADVAPALAELRTFLARVPSSSDTSGAFHRLLSLLHALDHLDRLEDLRQDFDELGPVPPGLSERGEALAQALADARRAPQAPVQDGRGPSFGGPANVERLGAVSRSLAEARRTGRARLLESVAAGETPPEEGRLFILHLKRLDRMAYHAWRAAHHLHESQGGTGGSGPDAPRDLQEEASAAATGEADGEPGAMPMTWQEFRTTEA